MVEGFGTAAFAGAVLAVLRWVRSVLHRKSREVRGARSRWWGCSHMQ